MPRIVDREKVKANVLSAFEECIRDKPISNISLRDIAKKAHITHPTLLNYFQTKEDIITAYCEHTKLDMVRLYETWFNEHDPGSYPSPLSYLDAFMCFVAEGPASENSFRSRIQSVVLARYNQDIRKNIAEEAEALRLMLEQRLQTAYGDRIGPAEAEILSVLIKGTYACRYSGTLTGAVNKNMVSLFSKLK